jgi:hypothetical protein
MTSQFWINPGQISFSICNESTVVDFARSPIPFIGTSGEVHDIPSTPLLRQIMKLLSLVFLFLIATHSLAEEYKPQLFKSLKLVYEDTFDAGTINGEVARRSSAFRSQSVA